MENQKLTELFKNSINKKLIYLVAILILIPLLLLIGFKFTPKNRAISKLNNFINEINLCNETLKNAINDQSIETNDAVEILTSGILKLDSIKDNVDSTEMHDNIVDLKSSFKRTLDYNISLYEISLSILKDPKSKELSNKHTALSSTLELFSECSNNLELLGIQYNLNKNSKTFFLNIKNYSNALIKLNRDSDIVSMQKRDFLMEIENCISSLDSIKQDLKPAIDKVKSDGRSLTVIIDDINSKKSLLESIKKNISLLSIPQDAKSLFASLNENINSYSIYIFSLEKAVALNSTTDDNSSDSLYKDSYDKYKDFLTTFSRLKEQVISYKTL